MIASGQLPAPDRVLIIKPSALGDVVTAAPVLRGLRRSFPRARIAWLLSETCAPLVRHDSALDDVILFERTRLGRAWRSPSAAAALARFLVSLRGGRFDWVIDLQGLLRSGLFAAATLAPLRAGFADAREGAWAFYNMRVRPRRPHAVDRNLDLIRRLGVDATGRDMRLEISVSGRNFADAFCSSGHIEPGGFLVCAPTTRWPTKLYPVRHWRTLVSRLSRRLPVVLIGASGDRALCRQVSEDIGPGVIDLAGETAVDEMVGLIAASAGVICCDSAAKFIAPAVGVDCITLIGPTRLERTGPYCGGEAILADVPCQGCLKRRCRHITCMQTIDPFEVISAAHKMLDAKVA